MTKNEFQASGNPYAAPVAAAKAGPEPAVAIAPRGSRLWRWLVRVSGLVYVFYAVIALLGGSESARRMVLWTRNYMNYTDNLGGDRWAWICIRSSLEGGAGLLVFASLFFLNVAVSIGLFRLKQRARRWAILQGPIVLGLLLAVMAYAMFVDEREAHEVAPALIVPLLFVPPTALLLLPRSKLVCSPADNSLIATA